MGQRVPTGEELEVVGSVVGFDPSAKSGDTRCLGGERLSLMVGREPDGTICRGWAVRWRENLSGSEFAAQPAVRCLPRVDIVDVGR